jgi:3-oxoacyl-[acyl-carrier protein] reductase
LVTDTAKTQSAKAVCVVGATGGIGAATCRLFAAQGWRMVLMDLATSPLKDLAVELRGTAHALDMADAASVEAAFAAARQETAGLDALVLASGVVEPATALAQVTDEAWAQMLAINLTGVFLCCRAAVDWLRDGGRIVTLSSNAERPAYAASKGGVEALTKALANQLAPRRITVNAVAPGATDTPMLDAHPPERIKAIAKLTPLGRIATAQDIAAAIAFLASHGAAHMTGVVLPVNGGQRMD